MDRVPWLCVVVSLSACAGVSDDIDPSADVTVPDSVDAAVGVDARDVHRLSVARVWFGAEAVRHRGCVACHQQDDGREGILSGSDAAVPGTRAYGPNLTPDVETGLGGWTDAKIVRAMRQGVGRDGRPLCAMPRFDDMDDGEAAAIVDYLRSLPIQRRRRPPSQCDDDGG
jgi:hypothetical protein